MAKRKLNATEALILFVAICNNLALGQSPSSTTLVIDLQNAVEYQSDDLSIPSKLATNPNLTPSTGFRNFGMITILGDIVAVNGQPAKGLYAGRSRGIVSSPAPGPGGAIADVTRTAMREHYFEILKSDGTAVGTIMSLGFSGGPAPPGAPSTERANWAIVGGTGAFLGARGLVAGSGGSGRAASMSEDPGYRRINGGTAFSFILHVIPLAAPQIVLTPNGPAVTHAADGTLVTTAKPARAGEILTLFASGLGPTRPGVDPGQPFPASPSQIVNSPLQVLVDGDPGDVLYAGGYPGAVDGFQVNFRVPDSTTAGQATIQLSSAWITGPVVRIPVR